MDEEDEGEGGLMMEGGEEEEDSEGRDSEVVTATASGSSAMA